MSQKSLQENARRYAALKELKGELNEQIKQATADMEGIEAEMISEMLDLDMPKFVHGGFSYSLSLKTYYNIKAENRDEGFEQLRALGLGYLIQERVDDRTLTNTLNDLADEHGGALPEAYNAIPLSTYEKNKISMRKERATNARKTG